MYIGVVSHDSKYKELFQNEEEIETAVVMDQVKEDHNTSLELSALLVDGKFTPHQELAYIRDKFPNIPMFYKLHDIKSHISTKHIERICAAHRVTPINERYTIEQVVSEVMNVVCNKGEYASKRIVSFFGTHSGVGVSTTVLSIAKSISQRVHEKVLVLSLNAWDPADYFLQYEGKYLNDLKVELKTKSLTPVKLGEAVSQHGDFYHLAGNRDIKLQRFYKNDEIAHLIDVAKETFDLILIDGGTHFDTANASQSYVSSNLRFIVTNQEDKGYRGYFPHTFQQLIEPAGGTKSDFMLVLNRFQPNMSLISEKDLEEELEINRVATLPDMDILGAVSIRQKSLLYDVAEGNYKKNIDTISNLIISESQLSEKPVELHHLENKKGIFSSLFGKKKEEKV
ncbi:ParA family protein [Aquibacillus sp. 3ASR75-11]|uniref:ParA family protein n=1 Tax=Terrihalobacillus insolitus TaxID=2950438 RepID=A0A9X3WQM2_9BACI|nr:ParA family protein [Terrihalobacillus insolitus]MDC3424302.1 ParA family protein [Terrihalobacillus insolitus]